MATHGADEILIGRGLIQNDGDRFNEHYLVLKGYSIKLSGGDSEEVTPVPMPNTVVKLFSADGSGLPPARVGRCWTVFLFYVKINIDKR